MAKLKKRIHKDTKKLAGMVNKKSPTIARKSGKVAAAGKTYKRPDHFRPPVADEWRALQEGDTQSHYNFFKLQADEFLGTVHRNQEHAGAVVDKWLIKLTAFLGDLQPDEDKWDIAQRMPWLKKIVVPCDLNTTNGLKGTFKFVPPKSAPFAVGSHTIATSVTSGNSVTVDVAIEMPKEFFQTADYLNFTYHFKKALYMCYILKMARKNKHVDLSNAQFTFLEDNPLQPVVVVPVEGSKIDIKVQLHFCLEQGVYKLNRFIPSRNNIRAAAIIAGLAEEAEATLNTAPTYHYNNSILRDLVLKENHLLIVQLIANFPAVADALVLLKYWIRRRFLHKVLPGYALNLLMCHLIKTKKVNPAALSYYQIIRIFFSHFHLTTNQTEFTLSETAPGSDGAPTFADIGLVSDVCFLDTTGFYNIFASMKQSDMKRIVLESEKSLQMIDKSHTNAFQWLFMNDIPETVVFDHIFHFEYTPRLLDLIINSSDISKVLIFGADVRAYLCDLICKLLSKGLGKRMKLVQCLTAPNSSWSITETPAARNQTLTFGIILDPEQAFDVIIKGPQANDPAAAEFREFWGEKSQLRRFKDGSVTEACVFGASQDNPTEKRLVTSRIVEHLLGTHLSFGGNKDESLWKHYYFANQLTCELKATEAAVKHNILDLETQSLTVLREFNAVEMELRRLEGLPLDITGILGVSPIFYYCEPRKNFPTGYCVKEDDTQDIIYGNDVYDAVLTLAVSGKWPEDLEAIKRLKAAFYMEIAKRMRGLKGFFCRVDVNSICILKGGYTFRFRLAHAKELQLMRQGQFDGVVGYRDTPESLAMEKELFIKPTLASALHGLHQQHNAFGPTVCLASQWLNSQLLDAAQWPNECTELIVASLFMDETKSITSEAPVQPQAGFFRFLHLMANKNWETEFVLLNFNEGLSQNKIDQIQSSFTMNRSKYPPVSIITSFDDKFGGIWAKEAPILQVLIRVIMLSRELLLRLTEKVFAHENFSNRSVFLTQYSGYDAIINLDMEDMKFLRRNIMQSTSRRPADFNPVEMYIRELRAAYGDVALFFYNGITPQKIGVLWKPSVDVPRDFRISDVNCRYFVDNQLVFNKKAICNDFLLIGNGLAVDVE